MLEIRAISPEDRALIQNFLMDQWYETQVVIRGKRVELAGAPGFIAWEDGAFCGLITYAIRAGECEILSLNSLTENKGIGTRLVSRVVEEARAAGCRKIKLITTNDNIRAIRFYQKRGFDMARLYRNAMDVSRKLKPAIPETGLEGIPLRHEIGFEMNL